MLKASKHEAISKIRSRQRAVEDYDVDRPQVQAWRHVQPSGTNCPKSSGGASQRKRNKGSIEKGKVDGPRAQGFLRCLSRVSRRPEKLDDERETKVMIA